jgi:bacillithiol biosynthesis cysteine-adding enzyme BshC
MEVTILPFAAVPQLAAKDLAYATQNPAFRPFFKYEPRLSEFEQVIADKKKDATNREVLVEILNNQYAAVPPNPKVADNIAALLDENTFTVVTAHQPSLFTGPLFFVYKIISTINLAEQLNAQYPGNRFVPVFVNGGEDHDFEEVNHAHVFGKKITWEAPDAGGSVGAMSTTSLPTVLEQLQTLLGENEAAKEIFSIIETAYSNHSLYGNAANELVNKLFGQYGLVTINMNVPELKKIFAPIIREEIFNQPSQPLIEATQKALSEAGFSSQAHAREINLFYLQPGRRDRIVKNGDQFEVLGANLHFNSAEMEQEIDTHPERFSPNVALRPLFQELILPNLAYVGGGGEIAYWLERKTQFAHFGINFPMLIRRNSVMWIDRPSSGRMEKLGLDPADLFQDTDALIRHFLEKNTENELSLETEKASLQSLFDSIQQKALLVDPTLEKAVAAEAVKQLKVVEQLEGRLLRAEKQKQETAVNQIRNLKEKFFPNNGLQERVDNFLNLYTKYGSTFFEVLKNNLNPLESGMVIVRDKE